MFDHLTQVTLAKIAGLEANFRNLPEKLVAAIDYAGLVLPQRALQLSCSDNREFDCLELIVTDTLSQRQYLAGDMYPAYFCLWWPTRIDFTEFLIHAQGFLASARAVLKHPCCPAQRKVFDGFNIFVDDSPEPVVVPLEECADFDLEILKQYIGPTSVQMVRISTEIGDICYDFEAYGGIPQRAGIISHHAIAEPIAELLRATNHLPVSIREARRVLESCFGARNEWKEGRRHEV